jgi:hypothetical protein
MTRHEKIDPRRPVGFDEPAAAFDAAAARTISDGEALAVLRKAVEDGLASGPPQDPRTADEIKAEGRRRLALLRGQ